jgi:Na+-transporting methylmalonyl-CoA/oxaloacetate decarboxylase gamma subunit
LIVEALCMLAEGIRLMAVGMVTVFAFLTLLVGVMSAQAAFFRAFGDRFADPRGAEGDEDEAVLALVLAAAHAKRQGDLR